MRATDALLKLFGLCVLAGVLLAAALFPIAAGAGVVSNRANDAIGDMTSDLLTLDVPMVTTVTDRSGEPIAHLFDQNRTPAGPDDIANTMKAAIVAIEDQRFFDHRGVDWQGTIRAALTNQFAGEITQGGSTLTQQYVKNYLVHVVARTDAEKAKAIEQTPARKLREIRVALQLERQLDKEEILARYLNVVPFGNRAYGVAAAAQTYFDTTPDRLTIPQAALLAGMANSPSSLNPERHPDEALTRRDLVIDAMLQQQRITPQAAEWAKSEPLGLAQPLAGTPNGCVGAGPSDGFVCKYVVDYLEQSGLSQEQLERGGYVVRTSLDHKATAAAKAAAERHVPKDTPGIANAVTVVEPGHEKHQVRALVANRDFGLHTSKGQTSYALPSGVTPFGAGSIYKVFTAAAALEQGMGIQDTIPAPASYTAHSYQQNGRPYTVGNAEGVDPGPRSLQDALATSPNTAFVALQERVGLPPAVDMAGRLGLRKGMHEVNAAGSTLDGTNGPTQAQSLKERNQGAFTLGFGPTSPLELGNVAATLMSDGRWCPPSPIEEIRDRDGNPVRITEKPCEQAIHPDMAHGMVQGMSKDDQPEGTSFNAARGAGWSRPMLGKTGTTQSYWSAGFIGATPQFAGSVLTFTDGDRPQGICDSTPPRLCGANEGNIYGGKIPARTWFDTMNPVHEGLPVLPLPEVDARYRHGGDSPHVPDVVGMPPERARAALREAGYPVEVRSMDSDVPRGTVASQTPRGIAGRGETVTLLVSTGTVPAPHTVPAAKPAGTGSGEPGGTDAGGSPPR